MGWSVMLLRASGAAAVGYTALSWTTSTKTTQFVITTMVVAAIYDGIVIPDDGDYGPVDLGISVVIAAGLMEVMN